MKSSIGEEVRTETSEDLGFKKLGQATILPSYNEKLPFASLQNLDICNENGLYVASSGGKVVIGELQSLRDFIQNHKDVDISFRWEKDFEDVIKVKFLSDKSVLIVCKAGVVYRVDCTSFELSQDVCSLKQPLLQCAVFQSRHLIALTDEGKLIFYDMRSTASPVELANGVASFDLLQGDIYLLLDSNCIQTHSLTGSRLELQLTVSVPAELLEELGEQYQPLVLKALNKTQSLVVYGEKISETTEDVMYDHKMYIVNCSQDSPTFSESFDITPAFGSVLRYPTSYSIRIEGLAGDSKTMNILASACSSEVTIWDSAEVVQPSQDSERAVLPISKVTDNDTNPVGMALDLTTVGDIAEPCQGVDSVKRLPLVYILNNEGNLQIVGLYHSAAIKNGTFKVPESTTTTLEINTDAEVQADDVRDRAERTSDQEPIGTTSDINDDSTSNNDEVADEQLQFSKAETGLESKSISDTSALKNTKTVFDTPAFGSTGDKPAFDAGIEATSGKPSFSASETQSAFAAPSLGGKSTESAFSKPSFGGLDSKGTFGSPAFGSSSFGSSDTKPAFGTSSFGGSATKPAFGTPSFGGSDTKPAFGSSSFGSSDTKPAFGTPSFGGSDTKPAFGSSSFGSSDTKPAFGTPSFGGSDTKPAFGTPSFGGSDTKPAFGSSSFGRSDTKPAFGSSSFGGSDTKSAFGTSPFGSNTQSTFGKPSFGTSDGKTAFGTPSFSSSGTGSTFGKSPFGDLGTKLPDSSAFGKPSFGDTASKSAFNFPASGSSETKPAFGTPSFGNLGSKSSSGISENKPAFSTPSFGASKIKEQLGSIGSGTAVKDPETKHSFGTVSFGSGSKSPFASLSDGSLQVQNSSVEEAPFGKFAQSNFTKSGVSPFASLASNKAADSQPKPFEAFGKTGGVSFQSSHDTSSKTVDHATDSDTEPRKSNNENLDADREPAEQFGEDDSIEKGSLSEENSLSGPEENSLTGKNQRVFSEVSSQDESESAGSSGDENVTELSDSTIEQTSTSRVDISDRKEKTTSSISAITARIKEGAKISTSDLKSTQFGEKNETRSASPFTAFTGDLKKVSSPGFSFANLSNSNSEIVKGSSNHSAAINAKEKMNPKDMGMTSPDVKAGGAEPGTQINPFLTDANTKKEKLLNDHALPDNKSILESDKDVSSLSKPHAFDKSSETGIKFAKNEQGSEVLAKNEKSLDISEESEHVSRLKSDHCQEADGTTTTTNDSSSMEGDGSTENSISSREESYDALDDVLPEELEEAMKVKHQVPQNEPNTSDKVIPLEGKAGEKNEYISQGVQVYESRDYALQTDKHASCDFTVQSFENSETYCALQNAPKALSEYFTSANICSWRFCSDDPTMRSIEKTYQVVSSEIAVWQENAKNIERFLRDQSTSIIDRRTTESLPEIYTWRIAESQQLQDIIVKQVQSFAETTHKLNQLEKQLAMFKTEKVKNVETQLKEAKYDCDYYETSAHGRFSTDLKYHQLEIQSELRRKMLNAAEKLNHVDKMLQILKMYTVEREQISDNAYVHKLARDLDDRDNLCTEITRLREQIDDLILRSGTPENQAYPSKVRAVKDEEVQSLPVAELCLKMRTRMQIGGLLKKK